MASVAPLLVVTVRAGLRRCPESTLARMFAPHFGLDEARALLQEVFNSAGDLELINGTAYVRIDPLSSPRRSRALAALCEELNGAQTRYPDTDLVLHFSVKDHPRIPGIS